MWRGLRAIAYCRPGRLTLRDASGKDVTKDCPHIRRLTRQLGATDAVLDGVIAKLEPVTYMIFDLLYLEREDLIAEPYRRRRELLDELELSGESWQVPAYSTGHAKELLAASRERGLAGLVLKRLDSPYESGKRSSFWLALRN